MSWMHVALQASDEDIILGGGYRPFKMPHATEEFESAFSATRRLISCHPVIWRGGPRL